MGPGWGRAAWRPSRSSRRGGADGFVTAEAAVVLPVLVLLTAVLVAGIAAAAAQIRCVDAAQAGARALARGEPDAVAAARVLAAAPAGARMEAVTRDGLVRYRVLADVGPPGALWAGVRFHVEHSAVAAVEGEAPP
nr:TadE family type IV pilus minor pilin [Streptomyces sp. SID3343]